ncbi:MAG: OmpA family protein [Verrucomicrobia bacterium]|nr:OmpA family protein [Verrucomicrobiota bacterium]
MINVRQSSRNQHGNALAPILLILGALVISALIFFFVTRKKIDEARAEEESAIAEQVSGSGSPASPPGKSPTPVGDKPSAATSTSQAPATFIKPVELAQQLTKLLAAGDLPGAAKLIAPDNSTRQGEVLGVLKMIFQNLGYKAGQPADAQLIGQIENMIRVAIPLTLASPEAPSLRITLDLERDPRRGWNVAQVHLPKELESALAALPPSPAPIAPPTSATNALNKSFFIIDRSQDALILASDFVNSLLRLDYLGALNYVDQNKISPVKLAALCMVFEEGKYHLPDDRALVATVATDTTSWVIVRVNSEATSTSTEFGLEMEKRDDKWRVGGLNLSKFLSDNAKASSLGDLPYTPLVVNPKGGESIALFFELNQAVLHPRAQKQLDIVASILKSSPQKKLKIGGYTDALGSDDYNLNLSKNRAEAVKQYFINHGVPVTQVETTGFGKQLPLSPNLKPDGTDNPEGRSRNRRAEILLDF